jgi:glycosyltransferase involved in cell wall biosynthesis
MTSRNRLAFLQTVNLGNRGRYESLRHTVDGDERIEARWYPQRSWVDDDWLRIFPAWWRVRLRQILDVSRLLLPRRCDAVVVHSPEVWGIYGTFHAIFRPRCLLVENSDSRLEPNGRIGTMLQRVANRRADLFVPWTNYAAEHIPTRVGYAGAPIAVVAPGVLVDEWPTTTATDRRHRCLRLLFVGGQPVRKGLDVVLDAFESHLTADCCLTVATQSRNLPEHLRARAERLAGVELHLDLRPSSAELHELFRNADLFVMPTRYDTYGFVFAEALASGLPAIATDVGGVGDIVIDGVTGFVVEVGDPDGLAFAVRRAMDLDPDEWTTMARAGREHVVRFHDSPTNARRLTDLVVDGIEQRRRHPTGATRLLRRRTRRA